MQKKFEQIGEFYAAGLFEEPNATPFVRFSRAVRRYLENREMPSYNGESLYPCGSFATKLCVTHHYSNTIAINWRNLEQKDPETIAPLKEFLSSYKILLPPEHRIGGTMWTHSFPNFRRIVREGFNSYEKRVEQMSNQDLRRGLLDVISGIRSFHARSLKLLKESGADARLCAALEKVPFEAADTLYEALVAWNFIYYMDGCDDIGRMDTDLIDFYRGEDVTDVIRRFFQNVDANDGWSGCLGPDYNALTLQCLKACVGIRRPSVELRITKDMPDDVWNAAIEAIRAGGGSPSLYNEEAYQSSLAEHFPHIPKEDLLRFCGGGCTETMLTGISNVGSLDAGINLALIFERYMREQLPKAVDFESFYKSFIDTCKDEFIKVFDSISATQKLRAKFRPQPMRTLLIDDCIEKEKDFNDGGARYTWSVVNIAGIINVLDSLTVINKVVFADRAMSGEELLTRLDDGETFLNYPNVERHGIDSDDSNALAARLSGDLCTLYEERVPYSGGKFLPASIQFTTYVNAGKPVGATPDGRASGEPLCDSLGAIFGNDRRGATALLNSASAIEQKKLIGTPVLNIKLEASQVTNNLKALTLGYFQSGGMQLQVTCVSREDLLAARDNPEKYPNLIVRTGGYSEYFRKLSPELRETVIKRTFSE